MRARRFKVNSKIIFLFTVLSAICAIYPLAVIMVMIGCFLYFLKDIPLNRLNEKLFFVVLISAFFGPYLALPAFPSLFLFRIVLWLHLFVFLFSKKELEKLKRIKVPLVCLGIWLLYAIFSLVWTENLSLSLPALYFQFEMLYLIFIVSYYIDSIAKLKKTFKWLAIAVGLSIFVGLWESVMGQHLFYSAGNLLSYQDFRATGFLVNTNDYSVYLSFYAPILFLLLLEKKTWFSSFMALGLMGILFFIIIQTESRSGLISFVLILLILLWKLIGNKLFFIVCSILGTLAICVYLGTHTLSFESLAFLSGKTDSTNERLLIYESVGRLVLEHHFLGVGPGVTPLYVFDALYGTVNVPVDVDDTMSAHNFWLSNLADVGFIGICPFLIFFSWMVIKAIKYGVKKGHLLKVVPLCILVAFIASTVASSSIFEMRVVWIGLGIGIAIIQLLQKKEEENICD